MDGVVSLILSRHIMDYQPMYTILVDYLVFVARHQSLDVTAPLNQDVRARQLCFKDGRPRNLGNVDVIKVTDKIYIQFWEIDKRERDVLFNDALNTFYLWLYGVRHMVKEGRMEMFYLTTHSTHFIYGYMASDIWLKKEGWKCFI